MTWDTDTDADEAWKALGEILPVWTGGTAQAPAKPPKAIKGKGGPVAVGIWRFVDATGKVSWAERKGAKIRVVLRAPAAVETKLAAETWTALK
jgi:hypothetical protein